MVQRKLAQIELLHRLSEAASRASDVEAVLQTSLDGLQEALGVDRSSLLLFDRQGVMRFRAWRGLSDRYRRAVEGHTPWGPDERNPPLIVVSDVREDPDLAAYGELFDAEGIRALVFVPLVTGGRLIGKFMLYYRQPTTPGDDDLQMAETLAGQMAAAIDRKRAEEALRTSEGELRAIFEAGGSGKALVDLPTGRFVRVNAALCRLTGYSEAELLDKTVLDVTHPADREATRRGVARLRRREIPVHQVEKRYLRSDGEPVWVQVAASLVDQGDETEPTLAAGVILDISERKRAEEALRRSEERWRILAETGAALAAAVELEETLSAICRAMVPAVADYSLLCLAEGGRLRQVAAAHRDAEREELLRQVAETYVPTSDTLTWKVFETGEPQLLSDLTPLLDERESYLPEQVIATVRKLAPRSTIITPLVASGEVLGTLGVVTDGTRPPYTEHDLPLFQELGRRAGLAVANARLYGELRERDRRKDEFLALLAHELRNPLAATVSALEVAALGGDRGRALEIARRQTRQMSRLVDDLLEVSRVTQGKIELRVELLELGSLVKRAVEAAQTAAGAQTRHRLTVTGADEPAWVRGDAPRLEQVIINLLTNALKYTPEGGEIALSLASGREEVKVEIRDAGVGIEADLLQRIFEPFVQGEAPRGIQGGLGIGLTLARLLAGLHGGRLEAASEGRGKGSTFTLHLPRCPAPAPAEVEAGAPALSAPGPAIGRVLLVEDNADTAETMESLLRLWGHQVEVARDAEDALAIARRNAFQPQVVLLDIGLPGMDGYELARRLRARPGAGEAVFIALTGFGQQADRERSAAAGFHHHLVKPVNPGELQRLLARTLAR